MCGIAGYSGREVPGLVTRMLDQIRHRGPDAAGQYKDDHVNLGKVRLSIIDLSGGHQPISNEDISIHKNNNNEKNNNNKLRAELEQKGHRFKTGSDTETIVHA